MLSIMADALKPRSYHLTPDRLVLLLLVIEGLLWLSERFGWPAWHKGYAVLTAVASVGVALLLMLLWFVAGLLFRWRFQFSIRSLLVLVLVVAIPCSWVAVEMKEAREQQAAVEEIKKLGGQVQFDYEVRQSGNPLLPPSAPPGPTWLGGLLGEYFFATVVDVSYFGSSVSDAGLEDLKGLTQLQGLGLNHTPVTDAGLKHLNGLTRLQCLDLTGTHITGAGFGHLKGMTQLQELYLDETQVTDAGLGHLKGMTQLQTLALGRTQVTDAGLEHLKGLTRLQLLQLESTPVNDAGLEHLKALTQLQDLHLRSTHVTDAGLEHLKGLTQLRTLGLMDTQVTDRGVKRLQKALPKCQIFH
jgi:hypothetical protein